MRCAVGASLLSRSPFAMRRKRVPPRIAAIGRRQRRLDPLLGSAPWEIGGAGPAQDEADLRAGRLGRKGARRERPSAATPPPAPPGSEVL